MGQRNSGLVDRAYSLYKKGGLNELMRGIKDYFRYKVKNMRWKSKVLVTANKSRRTVNGVSTRFLAEKPSEQFKLDTWAGEREVLEYFISETRKEDIIWDVGSHLGVYTVFGKSIGANVVSFDPDPYYANRTQENAELNDYDVDVRNLALGSENCQMTLKTDYGHLKADTNSSEGISVNVRTASSIVSEGIPTPSVVKIDVEGAEVDVLNGMKNILSSGDCRVLFIEVHHDLLQNFDTNENELKSILRKHEYNIEHLMSRSDTNSHIVAKLTSKNTSW